MYVDGYSDYSWRAMSTNNPKITAVQQICPYCKPKEMLNGLSSSQTETQTSHLAL